MTDLATLQTELLDLQQTMANINVAMNTIQTQISTLTEQEEFDKFIQTQIEPYFGATTAESIVRLLDKCRRNNNYVYFTASYQWKSVYGDLKKRQLLKLISAVYRVKYNKMSKKSTYSLRSEIKYAKACDDCGELARVLYDRLHKEGLI